MAPDVSPRPLPRPDPAFDLSEFLAGIEVPAGVEAVWMALVSSDRAAGLAVVGAAAILLLAGIVALRIVRRRRARPCRWMRVGARRGAMTRWSCRTCGIDAWSHDGRPPKECKRSLRPMPL